MKDQTITIDLSAARLDEGAYSKFAGQMERLLWQLYDSGVNVPINIIGKPSQVDSFMSAVKKEKRYMDAYINSGLDSPKTLNSRYALDHAVKRFELETGLKWPFKN